MCVTTVVKLRCIKVVIGATHAMLVCVCGAESEAITGWPDDKMEQSEHRGRTQVGADGLEGGVESEAYSTQQFLCLGG